MKQNRFTYFIIVLIIVCLGILSRKTDLLPLFVGDLLYAVMIYFGIRSVFIRLSEIKSALLSLLICYCIELLQLYDAEWSIDLRHTLFGRYVLGHGFLWSDILAYSFGILTAYYIEKTVFKKKS